jgi:hypothetical protein
MFVTKFLAISASLAAAGCGSAALPNHGLPPERLAQLENICATTMELPRGTAHFADCVDVLSETVQETGLPKAQP